MESYSANQTFWEKPTLIRHDIFWMSLCDCGLSLLNFVIWLPKIFSFKLVQLSEVSCMITGIVIQFCACGSVIWYIVIGWCLFTTLFSINNFCIHEFQSVFIGISMAIPLIYNEYGSNDNLRGLDAQCWLKDPMYYLTLYVPVIIALLMALFLLLCVWLQYCCNSHKACCGLCCQGGSNRSHKSSMTSNISNNSADSAISNASWHFLGGGVTIEDSLIIKRLTLFTIVFIIVWIFPLCDRMYSVITNSDAPFWLTILHHCGIGISGLANCYVWSQSHQFQSFEKSYRMMNQAKQETRIKQMRQQFNYDTSL